MNQSIKRVAMALSKPLPDKIYLKLIYLFFMHKRLNLRNPVTYNEKLNWLKLYDRNPRYCSMVDKIEAKGIIAEKIGGGYTVPTLGVWDKFENIDFDVLPDSFVLKCSHDSGSVIVCKDKSAFDYASAREKINMHLKKNAFYYAREWPYKNLKPRVFAETYLTDGQNAVLPVYKIFCFSGEPLIIQVIHNEKQPNETVDYYDVGWKKLDLRQNYPMSDKVWEPPKSFSLMLDLAKKLSTGIPHVRVDFYELTGEPYFSEFTFYNDAGICPFRPGKWDYELGKHIKLQKIE